jgi:hypothetical protein
MRRAYSGALFVVAPALVWRPSRLVFPEIAFIAPSGPAMET